MAVSSEHRHIRREPGESVNCSARGGARSPVRRAAKLPKEMTCLAWVHGASAVAKAMADKSSSEPSVTGVFQRSMGRLLARGGNTFRKGLASAGGVRLF